MCRALDEAVAGTTVPAFVERRAAAETLGTTQALSPGLRSRPSLSGHHIRHARLLHDVLSPGLRSRPSLSVDMLAKLPAGPDRLSPGLRSRPSLSDGNVGTPPPPATTLSPGLRSRPSLSDVVLGGSLRLRGGAVAGTTVPAFVERSLRPNYDSGLP